MRLAAWDARAGVLEDPAERDAVWRRAELSGSRMIAMEAKARREELGAAYPNRHPELVSGSIVQPRPDLGRTRNRS
jgi:hypothetical protein